MNVNIEVERTTYQSDEDDDELVAMISIDSNSTSKSTSKRNPIKIVSVVDISKSMEDGKLDLVKASLSFIIDNLTDNDELGIVQFGDIATTVVDLEPLTPERKIIAQTKIGWMKPSGSTNLSAGLFKGLKMFDGCRESEDPCKCILLLFTDGEANRGIINIEGLMECLCKRNKENIDIVTLGFGTDHCPSFLKGISDTTKGGEYHYIPDKESIGPQFAECLGGLLSLVVQNVEITFLDGIDEYSILEIYSDEKLRKDADGDYVLELGDLYQSQQKNIVFKVHPKRKLFELQCLVSYDIIGGESINEEPFFLRTSFTRSSEPPLVNTNVRKHYNRVMAVKVMEDAMFLAQKDLVSAKRGLIEFVSVLEKRTSADDDLTPILIDDIRECIKGMTDYETWWKIGKSTLNAIAISHNKQRSRTYNTPTQVDMINRLSRSEAYVNASTPSRDNYVSRSLGISHK